MTILTQDDIALQMIAQLRVLDPSVSAELGTPERKIIDTVAQALAEAQLDLSILQGSMDIDALFGTNLGAFLQLFGFARQRAGYATGVVRFSRNIATTADIRIPNGTQVASNLSTETSLNSFAFATTNDVILPAGQTSVTAPIRATIPGTDGNVAANTVTSFVTSPVLGITAVTNPAATSGGTDIETDDALKVRFKNTGPFRNLAGTGDQYLALMISTIFATKANVVGPLSRYREYVQVPNVDDGSAFDVNGDGVAEAGNGNIGQWTTALSTIPYSKHVYDTLPAFVSTGSSGPDQVFFTQDIDFVLNTVVAKKAAGDAYRLASVGAGSNPLDPATLFQPNVTFLTVYTGTDTTVDAPIPGQTLLFEHSYMSSASRNDYDRNITNCVDTFVDGGNDVPANTVLPVPTTNTQFLNNQTYRYHYDNFRRVGEPDHRPIIGNVYVPLFWQPVTALPPTIAVGTATYILGTHYWPVEDISNVRGTVRARNGIEWSTNVRGQVGGDPLNGPYTGPMILNNTALSFPIDNYTYDRNIVDTQVALEAAKQTTTDVLVHKAAFRYFKFDITVMYLAGSSNDDVNTGIRDAINGFFQGLFFGATIQLSDILQFVHEVPGVDNVRWTRDIDTTRNRCTETNSTGSSRVGIIVDRKITGSNSPATAEVQQAYITGTPTGGTYTLSQMVGSTIFSTAPIPYNALASDIQTALGFAGINVSIAGLGTPASPFVFTFPLNGPQSTILATPSFTGGTYALNNDFFLQDNELPALPTSTVSGDTVEGFIIRPRAQNTWTKGG